MSMEAKDLTEPKSQSLFRKVLFWLVVVFLRLLALAVAHGGADGPNIPGEANQNKKTV